MEKRLTNLPCLLRAIRESIAEAKDPYTEDRLFWVIDALENMIEAVSILADVGTDEGVKHD